MVCDVCCCLGLAINNWFMQTLLHYHWLRSRWSGVPHKYGHFGIISSGITTRLHSYCLKALCLLRIIFKWNSVILELRPESWQCWVSRWWSAQVRPDVELSARNWLRQECVSLLTTAPLSTHSIVSDEEFYQLNQQRQTQPHIHKLKSFHWNWDVGQEALISHGSKIIN